MKHLFQPLLASLAALALVAACQPTVDDAPWATPTHTPTHTPTPTPPLIPTRAVTPSTAIPTPTATPPPLGSMRVEPAFPNLPLLNEMTSLTSAGDGSRRLFVTLKPGLAVAFPNEPGASATKVFLDIRDRVNDSGSEEGFLGLAFDPQYATNGYFYVNYTALNPRRSVISRFSVSAENPDRADLASELVLLEVGQPFSNHNGGTLAFGPDGYLYIGLGDGGSGGDPQGNGQSLSTLLGKMLRIDVRGATRLQPYRMPPDNPFAGSSTARQEIWTYGLRNPWKFSFDTLTGDLWAADVGQNAYEEVDIIQKGFNYGWNVMEGLHCYPP
ncbi:MAG: PQQ-dependent sugar dehydrogenase, partial [Chloroflexota bacterium]|nr:PQQ-dependent sugar dehydrogenase [Chloroflexota bacterium]